MNFWAISWSQWCDIASIADQKKAAPVGRPYI